MNGHTLPVYSPHSVPLNGRHQLAILSQDALTMTPSAMRAWEEEEVSPFPWTFGGSSPGHYHSSFAHSWTQKSTLLNLKKKDPALLSINLFEYVSIIVNLAACIEAIGQIHNKNSPPDPVVQIWTDNTTASAWNRKMSSGTGTTNESKSLARLFCYILMHWRIGVSGSYIKGEGKSLADKSQEHLTTPIFNLTHIFMLLPNPSNNRFPRSKAWGASDRVPSYSSCWTPRSLLDL